MMTVLLLVCVCVVIVPHVISMISQIIEVKQRLLDEVGLGVAS